MKARTTPRDCIAILAALLALLAVISLIALTAGSERIHLATILKIFLGAGEASTEQRVILLDLRLPRIILAIVAGGGLAVAGAAYQALLRNPLAEPYVLGVSTGAAVGALLAFIFAESIPASRPLMSFVGAMVTILLVYRIGEVRSEAASNKLLLAGVIVNSFFSATIIFLTTLASASQLRGVTFWLLGDLTRGGEGMLWIVSLLVLGAVAVIYTNARSLNLMMVGERDAMALGVEVKRVKFIVFALSSLITGAVVAVSGSIGYVGLVVPHIIRLAFGSDHRLLIPAAMVGGATLLVLADTVARTVLAPQELPVGAITAIIGAPVFLHLLRRMHY